MRIGANTWIWNDPTTTENLSDLIPVVASAGFDLVEVPFGDPASLDLPKIARMIAENNLAVSACAVLPANTSLVSRNATERNAAVEYIQRCIDAAAELGAEVIAGPFYAPVGQRWRSDSDQRAAELGLLSDSLGVLADYAEQLGIEIAVEPLNRFESSVINTCKDILGVVNQVNSPACGIMLDTFHMGIEERSLAEAIEMAGQRLVHFQASENDRGSPGSGHTQWTEVSHALRRIGYDRAVVIESFTPYSTGIADAACIWRPLAETQNELAITGLAFLRRLFTTSPTGTTM